MKTNIFKFASLLAAAFLYQNAMASAADSFTCEGKTMDGQSIFIRSHYDVYESMPPQDRTDVTVGSEHRGGPGTHGLSFAPGKVFLKVNSTAGQILFSLPKVNGRFDMTLTWVDGNGQAMVPTRTTLAKNLECKGLRLSDYGRFDGLRLKRTNPYHNLVKDVESEIRQGEKQAGKAVRQAGIILKNLVSYDINTLFAFEGLLMSDLYQSVSANALPMERYELRYWGDLVTVLMERAEIPGELKVALLEKFAQKFPAKKDEAIYSVFRSYLRGFTAANFDRLMKLADSSAESLLQNQEFYFQTSEALSDLLFLPRINSSEERAHLIELLFVNQENDNHLQRTLRSLNRNLTPAEFTDFMQVVVPRLLKSSQIGEQTVEAVKSIAERQSNSDQRRQIENLRLRN